ncbi:hypothetical protein NLJ89_g9472 [Agrocybe chaxingu]|uniref:Uncharacterized protein n=1 Tax=Agrocybe chaxingu TaxID=84603 RepID=A0A9W8MTI4_9AGAR|nr:hypothetical protein NLJ89_g9472 [Agrocybe chaxingu]
MPKKDQTDLREYKLLVAGEISVGKSGLTLRLTEGRFIELWDPVIEDIYRKKCVVDKKDVLLSIYDSPDGDGGGILGLTDREILNAEGFLLVFSVGSRSSFDAITSLHQRILRVKDTTSPPIVLVGHKCDLPADNRQISTDEGVTLARQLGCPYIETSAKEGINVEEAFSQIVREIWKCNKEELEQDQHEDTSGCCARCIII